MRTEKPIRELRKCLGCPRYFWTVSVSTEAGSSDWAERNRYCSSCWNDRLQRPMTLDDIEASNQELSEEEKQMQNDNEVNGRTSRRFRAS